MLPHRTFLAAHRPCARGLQWPASWHQNFCDPRRRRAALDRPHASPPPSLGHGMPSTPMPAACPNERRRMVSPLRHNRTRGGRPTLPGGAVPRPFLRMASWRIHRIPVGIAGESSTGGLQLDCAQLGVPMCATASFRRRLWDRGWQVQVTARLVASSPPRPQKQGEAPPPRPQQQGEVLLLRLLAFQARGHGPERRPEPEAVNPKTTPSCAMNRLTSGCKAQRSCC